MALNQVGSALNYEELLDNAQRSIGNKVFGSDKLAKANEIVGQITTTHLLLSQFGFYKSITNKVKELGAEYEQTLKSKLAGLANLNDDMGTELKTIANPVAPLNEGYNAEEGVFATQITRDAPEPQVDSEVTREGNVAPLDYSTQPDDIPPINIDEPPIPIEGFPFPAPRGGAGYQNIAANDTIGGLIPNYATNPPAATPRIEYNPNQLFEDDAGLPSVDMASQAPLFLGQASGDVGVRARGAVVPQEAPPTQTPTTEAPRATPMEGEVDQINNERTTPLQVPQTQAGVPAEAPVVPPNPYEGMLVAPATEGDVTAGLASEARGILAAPAEASRSSFLKGFSNMYNKAQDLKTSVENGVQRFNRLRNQATDAFDSIKAGGQATLEKGKSLLQQGQEAIANGDLTGQDLVDRGNSFINEGIEQAKNSDLGRQAFNQAQDYIQRGNTLLSQGKAEGQGLLEQGNDLLKASQTQIEGYGDKAASLVTSLDSEVAQRTSQLAELAGAGGSAVFGALSGVGIASAFKSGNKQQEGVATSQAVSQEAQGASKAVAGGEAGVEAGGEVGGEVVGESLAAAIPVVGEVIDAGLLLTQLFTGIASEFKPHDAVTSIVSATQQYGV